MQSIFKSVNIIEHPRLRKHQDYYFVRQGEVCIADYNTPIMTGGVATCSTIIVHDTTTKIQMLGHVSPMDYSGDIRDGIDKHFNSQSDTFYAVIIPGAGISGTQPRLSVPIAQEALYGIKHKIVADWYTNYLEFILIKDGIIQKNEEESVETVTQSLACGLICKSF